MRLRSPASPPRRGMILLVVLVLLTLFAIVGVAFVTFSENQTTTASYQKSQETENRPDPDLLLGYVLNQLVFDTGKGDSALRTHSLMRNMYGGTGNSAFNGIGRRRQGGVIDNYYLTNLQGLTLPAGGELGFAQTFGNLCPSYTYPDHNNTYLGALRGTGEVISRSYVRTVRLGAAAGGELVFDPYSTAHYRFWSDPYYVPPGVSATVAAALTSPATNFGRDLRRAMVMRPGPWDHPNFPPPDNAGGDVKNLPPGTRTMVDVAGATPIYADNDSIWVDLGFPVQTDSQGRRYKPLFAFFIQDLDGKVNLNMHGNIRGNVVDGAGNFLYNTHASNQGWGPWEVNVGRILAATDTDLPPRPEWLRLFGGRGSLAAAPTTHAERGRYGWSTLANNPATIDPDILTPPSAAAPQEEFWAVRRGAPIYSRYDFDGAKDNLFPAQLAVPLRYTLSDPWLTPRVLGAGPLAQTMDPQNRFLSYDRFPRFQKRTGLGPVDPLTFYFGYGSNGTSETYKVWPVAPARQHNHPLYFNPWISPTMPQLTGNYGIFPDRTFRASDLEALYRHGDTGADAGFSSLRRLLPASFNNAAARRLVTTHSTDIDRPGAVPYLRPFNAALGDTPTAWGSSHALQLLAAYTNKYPSGPPIRFPNATPTPVTSPVGDYVAHWRSLLGATLRMDINRLMPDYPELPAALATGRITYDTTNPTIVAQYNQAQRARQELARDFYLRLILTTGAIDPTVVTAADLPLPVEQLNALRYLAQLAVNMVDYMDGDDFVTPFNWGAIGSADFTGAYVGQWVYGTEMPRVLLNELYAERQPVAGGNTPFNLFIELFNPLSDGSSAFLAMPPTAAGGPDAYGVHRIIVARPDGGSALNLRHAANVLGDLPRNVNPDQQPSVPNAPALANSFYNSSLGNAAVIDFKTPALPGGQNYRLGDAEDRFRGTPGVPGTVPQAFYVIGPDAAPFPAAGGPTSEALNYSTPQLSVIRPGGSGGFNNQAVVMLQRLACPHLPPNPAPDPAAPQNFLPVDPALPLNPYITIDYVDLSGFAAGGPGTPYPINDSAAPNEEKYSIGKRQPFAGFTGGGNRVWSFQTPDSTPATLATIDKYTDRPQHTFYQHNSIERALPSTIEPAPGGPAAGFILVNAGGVPVAGSFLPNPTRADAAYAAGGSPMTPNPDPLPAGAYQTLDVPFDWCTHLDRECVNPLEFLHVSGFKPHELTQEFIKNVAPVTAQEIAMNATGANITKFGHYAPWFDQNARIYRVLELLENRHRTAMMSVYQLRAAAVTAFTAPAGAPYSTQNVPAGTNMLRIQLNPLFGLLSGTTANYATYNLQVGSTVGLWIGSPANENIARIVNIVAPDTIEVVADPGQPPPASPLARNIAVVCSGGVQPGKININTAYDMPVWWALVDPQNANEGLATDLNGNGVPDYVEQLNANLFPTTFRPGYSGIDAPFQGFAPGASPAGQVQYPTGQGIANTYFRPSPTNPNMRIFERGNPAVDHPAKRLEPLMKIFNNVTSRSNCFAVWVTVGYFEVGPEGVVTTQAIPAGTAAIPALNVTSTAGLRVNQYLVIDRGTAAQETVRVAAVLNSTQITVDRSFTPVPARFAHTPNATMDTGLQQEIGRFDGTAKRHRFFSVIDRASTDVWMQNIGVQDVSPLLGNLALDPRRTQTVALGNLALQTPAVITAGSTRIISAPALIPYIRVGSQLVIDAGRPNQEVVTVLAVDPVLGTFTALFAQAHTTAAPDFTSIGFPNLPPLVLHSSVIE